MYRRILFRPEADPTGSVGGTATATPPATDPPSGKADDGKGEKGTPPPEKTYTQAEIDEMIGKRLARERKSWEAEVETERKKAAMDEAERLKTEKEDAERRATEAEQRAERTLIAAEAKLAILAAGAKADRVERILGLLDLADIAVTDGKPDGAAVTNAVNALKGELPELFAGPPAPGRSGADMSGQGKPTFTAAQIKEMSPAEYVKNRDAILAAMREGRVSD